MAFDLFFGKKGRNWAREGRPELITAPTPSVVVEPGYAQISKAIKETNEKVKVKPTGGGAVVARRWKWG